jgi:hypothetical protein
MVHEFSSRHRHDQLGIAERVMQTIGICYRAMMNHGNAPACDTPDCLRHANVIRNHTPTRANNGATPREKRLRAKMTVNAKLLKGPLFCLVFAHVYKAERDSKHADRGVACVYLGYDAVNNTFLVKEWRTGERYYSADVVFHSHIFPYRANPQRAIGGLTRYDELAPHLSWEAKQPFAAPPRGKSTRVHDYMNSGGRALRDIPDQPMAPNQEPDRSHEGGNFSSGAVHMVHSFGADPKTWPEALASHDADLWIEADLQEQASFKQHEVYEVVTRESLNGKRVYGYKKVMKRKLNPPDDLNPAGSIDKYKVRLTIQAFTKMMIQGIDYEEKYASQVRWNTIKIMFAIAVWNDYEIATADVKTFFLYEVLKDVMHMEIPAGWEQEGQGAPDFVWRLKKSVYGMPQAGHCAQKVLWETLEAGGRFKQSTADDCVHYSANAKTGYAAVGEFVDDMLITGDKEGLSKTERQLTSGRDGGTKLEVKMTLNPKIFCGVQIERDRENRWLKLHQQAYTENLVQEYRKDNARPVDTPMDPGTAKHLMQLPTEDSTPTSIKAFQEIVGKLMWLLKTRPDMHFTINLLTRFLKVATDAHVKIATGRPLIYLAGTSSYGIVYAPGKDWVLSGTSDSDLAGDLDTARSTYGTTTQIGEYGNLSCTSKLSKKVATSTGQAETHAYVELCKEIVWDRHLFAELGFPQRYATPAFTDNDGVITQSTKAINHTSAKHYRIGQAYVRQLNRDQVIDVRRVPTDENHTDTLTKPLARILFEKHRLAIMGPQERPSPGQ